MHEGQAMVRSVTVALLCLSLAVWAALPSFTHAPSIVETIQDHLEMVEEHGHSHGLEDDLFWALHGHGHDVVDHDHNQAFLMSSMGTGAFTGPCETWRRPLSNHCPWTRFRIHKPPRV